MCIRISATCLVLAAASFGGHAQTSRQATLSKVLPCVKSLRVVQHGDTALAMAGGMGVDHRQFLDRLAQSGAATRHALRTMRAGDVLQLCLQPAQDGHAAGLASIRLRSGRAYDHWARPLPVRTRVLAAHASMENALQRLHVSPVIVAAVLDYARHHWHVSSRVPAGARMTFGYNGMASAPGGVLVYIDYQHRGRHQRIYHCKDDRKQYLADGKGRILRVLDLPRPMAHARISSGWGWRIQPVLGGREFHKGIDYAAPRGTPVHAVMNGVVQLAAWHGNYGRMVEVRHSDGVVTRYGHLARYAKGLAPGHAIHRGQTLGYVGSTGLSTGPHLYFEIWQQGRRIDPRQHLLLVEVDPGIPVQQRIRALVHDLSS